MGNRMGKKHPHYGKSMSTNFPGPHQTVAFMHFPYYGKLTGKLMHFLYDKAYHRMGIRWKESTHTMGNV